jgi:uncharacterized 2Fe-2S/4Fe-4S cluster protein (DUF4445 family)
LIKEDTYLLHQVTFLPDNSGVSVESGTTAMEAFRLAGIPLDAPCGGNGTCGKCVIRIVQKNGGSILKQACKTYINADMTIDISSAAGGHHILLEGAGKETVLSPVIKTVTVKVDRPAVDDLRSEWKRLKQAVSDKLGIDPEDIKSNVSLAASLYNNLVKNKYSVDTLVCNDEIIDVRSPGSGSLAIAFDIGTTTIVGYLLDLHTGRQIAASSMLNPQ